MAASRQPDLLDTLSPGHVELIVQFAKMFRAKRESIVQIIDTDFMEAVDVLHEDSYAVDEVQEQLMNLKSVVKSGLRQEQQTMINMMVLLLKMLTENADNQGTVLEVDMSKIEDAHLLQQAEDIRMERVAAAESKTQLEKRTLQLNSIKDENMELMKQKTRMEESHGEMTSRLMSVSSEAEQIRRERDQLARECERLRNALHHTEAEADMRAQAKEQDVKAMQEELNMAKSSVGLSSQEMNRLHSELNEVKGSLQQAEEENSTRLSSSKQVQQMRRMLNEKNDVIRDLRNRLEKYEPDTLRADDE